MNKHVGIDGAVGNNVIVPVQRAGVGTEVGYIMNILEASAQSATSTPNQQQGILDKDKRTATENALISQAGDKRFSLSARVFGWSEKRFWKQHYDLYSLNFKEGIDDKVVRINGAFGTKFETLTRKDLSEIHIRISSLRVKQSEMQSVQTN